MKRSATILCLIALVGGCVSEQNFHDLKMAHRRSQEQVIELQSRLEEAQMRIRQLQNDTSQDPGLLSQIGSLESENLALRQKLAEIEQALQEIGSIGPLPADLDQALMQLAQSYPDLMTYDASLGMIKFSSGPTFDLGSVKIKPEAQQSLVRLAEILNQPSAAEYEARIVGHTDNVRISRPATLKHHPSNWHLSVHRSIAVKDVLARAGVPETRMGVAGYGSHRPIAENKARGGNALNRRVEIYLVRRMNTSDDTLSMSPPPVSEPVSEPVANDAEGRIEKAGGLADDMTK